MQELIFYDMKGKEKFVSSDYELVTKEAKTGLKFFAVAVAPSGIDAYRIVSKEFYLENIGDDSLDDF